MGPRCLPLCHYRLLGRDGAVEGWVWGGGGWSVLCANINNSSQEGEETHEVKVRRNLMIGSFCRASVGFQIHHL